MNRGGLRFCDGAALSDGRSDGCHVVYDQARPGAWLQSALLPGRPDPSDLCPACAARRSQGGLPAYRPAAWYATWLWALLLAGLGACAWLAR